MCRIHTIIGVLFCVALATIFFTQFFDDQLFGIQLGNPGNYSVLQLIALFYNIVMLLFLIRIRAYGTFYATNSSDCFPCLTATCGILASFWALVLAISLVNAREIFIQTGLFFSISLYQTICLLLSSCFKQIEYDNVIREIIIEADGKKRSNSDISVNYDIPSKQPPKTLEDKATKTDNSILNVVELNDVQSDEFLQIQKWANLLSNAQSSGQIDSITDNLVHEMKEHYGGKVKTDVQVEMGRNSPKSPNSYELMMDQISLSGASLSSTSSLLSLLPENVLTKF